MTKKILLVDDSKVQLMVMKKMLLEALPGIEVIDFSSPKEALTYFQTHSTELWFAFLDYNMNDMTGIELAEKLVGLMPAPITFERMVLLSANVQEAVQKKATDLGLEFLAKPMNPQKLSSFLQRRKLIL